MPGVRWNRQTSRYLRPARDWVRRFSPGKAANIARTARKAVIADFAPADEIQMRLLQFMRQRFDHVSYEHVCSGVGIPHVYEFFRDSEKTPKNSETTERIAMAGDRTKAIIEAALDPAAQPAMRCHHRYGGFHHGRRGGKPCAKGARGSEGCIWQAAFPSISCPS